MWLLLACAGRELTDEQRAHVEARLAAAEVELDAAVEPRRAALAAAAGTVPGGSPCPIAVPVPSMEAGSTPSMEEAIARLRGAQFLSERLQRTTDLADLGPPPHLEVRRDRITSLRADLHDPGGPPGSELVARADALLPLGWDAVLVARLSSAPIAVGDSFEPGGMVGRLFVYDYDRRAVACLADAAATSSGAVRVIRTEVGGVPITSTATTDAVALSQDLVVNLLAAAIPALRAP